MNRRELVPRLIDSRNRIALTRDAMRLLDVHSGDSVEIDTAGGQVRLHKLAFVRVRQ